jgi:hypothetical protein
VLANALGQTRSSARSNSLPNLASWVDGAGSSALALGFRFRGVGFVVVIIAFSDLELSFGCV